MLASFSPYTLQFAFIARTSRETFTSKRTYFVRLYDPARPQVTGIGEIPPFPSLQPSFSDFDKLEKEISSVVDNIDLILDGRMPLPENSAIRFGIESALRELSPKSGQPSVEPQINGLVWMDDIESMRNQIDQKIAQGYKCIKIKIGAHNFDDELSLLGYIRERFPADELQIRVDANGAFTPRDVMSRLEALAKYDLHSIEQPLRRNCPQTPEICRISPVPVALDEDLIERWFSEEQMHTWLDHIRPAYIVVKPSLIGGFDIADKWIKCARELGIGWWATSALESNIGLRAIKRWLSEYPEASTITHGLGTGHIYTNNPEL